jgi:hypothetical protein
VAREVTIQHKNDTTSRANSPVQSDVSLAFGLGWDMTYLFTFVGQVDQEFPDVPDRLPSLARLPERKRSLIRLDRIRGPIRLFRDQFVATEVSQIPDVNRIEKQLTKGATRDVVRDLLCDLHYTLLRAFSTADNRLAKAYRLGRSLATTCLVANSRAALASEFQISRVARLDEWLADLATQLPPHSSRPVRLSLSTWQTWVESPEVNGKELDWAQDGKAVRQTLRRQGDIWRALLSGEKRGDAMLELPDFIDAARKVPARTAKLFSVMFLPLAIFLALICIGTAVALSDDNIAKEVVGFGAIVIGAIGAAGFTWKGPIDALRRSSAEIKKPLWGAVLDEEIAMRITEEPPGVEFEHKDASVAAPAPGPMIGRESYL